MYQSWVLLIIIFSLIILIFSVGSLVSYKCKEPEVEYRFIPRTFKQEQREPLKVNSFFDKMFTESSVNVYGLPLSLNAQRKLQGQILS